MMVIVMVMMMVLLMRFTCGCKQCSGYSTGNGSHGVPQYM
jgi:hypothetical protein